MFANSIPVDSVSSASGSSSETLRDDIGTSGESL